MLTNLFMAIVDKSIMGAMAIVVVFIVRMLLGKAPKKYSYILWAVIGIRLLCPGNIGMPSSFSVYNLIKLPNNTVYTEEKGNKTAQQNTKNTNTEFSTGKETVTKKNIDFQNTEKKSSEGIQTQKTEQGKNPAKSVQKGETSGTFMNPVNDREKAGNLDFYGIATVGAYLWIAGGVLFILWNSVLMYRLKKRVAKAVRFQKNVFECEGIPTPFVLGMFSPKIYIPFHMGEKERQYVIAHEQYHIKRKDYVFKMIGFLLCVVYWFNPFVWIGYFLMIRDMEMSCDEYVLKTAKEDIRKAYSESLLGFATNRRNITAGMLAFGESDTRRRVKHVMKFKKAGKWIGILAVVAIMAVGVCCLTDAKSGSRMQKKPHSQLQTKQKKKDIIPGTPSVSLQASSGADGSRLYYASEKRIIFGGYYGLFVYDTQKRNFVGKVDLKEIGCDATQGDDACTVSVKKDGTRVYLQKASEKETMYVYHVKENRITKEKNSLRKKELFSGVGEDMTSAVYEGKRGKGKVQLRNSWKTIGELGYSDSGKSNLVFPLFPKEEYKNANFWNPSHIQNLTKAEMTYNGIHYVCTDKKVLKRMEKALGNAKKEKGVSNCPFDDVMYLTRKDGSVGMIIPATDDCNSCLMGNGYNTYQVKDGEFHFQQMLEKGELKRFQADKEKESV